MTKTFSSSYQKLPSSIPNRLGTVMDKLTSKIFNVGDAFIEFKHVMEPFPDPIVITTSDTKIIYANPAWEKLTGYSLEEIKGKESFFLKTKKTNPSIYKRLKKSLSEGKTFTSDAIIDKKKDGTEYQIHSTIFPIVNNNTPQFYVQMEQDITNIKKRENLKEEFLQEAAHELKTPITALKLLVQYQIKKISKKQKNAELVQSLKLIDRDLDRLTRLINELSDVTRIEAGKLSTNMQIVNITDLVSDVVIEMQAFDKNHYLSFSDQSKLFVVADPDKIKQVLINIIGNAIKYSYNNSEISISIKNKKDVVIIAIKDRGLGISSSKLPYLFKRYYQIDKTHRIGLGLGLYISKEIIKKHKGKIWVESKEGIGSTFYIQLQKFRNKIYAKDN